MVNNVRSTNPKFETLHDKIKIFSNFIDSTILYIHTYIYIYIYINNKDKL